MMRPEEYPVEAPSGIFHFPQGIFCLNKVEDTGSEKVKVTRISGDEFELEITPERLSVTERKDFPIRVCKIEKQTEEDAIESPEEEPREIIKSEKRVDLTKESKHRVVVADGEILKIGNTITYAAGTNLITLDDSVGAGDSWGTAYDMENVLADCGAVVTKQGENAYDVSARMYFAAGVYFVSINEFVELKPNPINPSYAIASAAGSHIRIGEYDAVNGYSENGAFWRIYSGSCIGSNTNNLLGEVLIYGSNIWGNATSYSDGVHFSGTTRIYNSILKIKSYLWNADINLQDVKWQGTGGTYTNLCARGFTHAFAGWTTFDSNYGIFASGTTDADFDLYDITFKNCGTSYFSSSGNNYLVRLINSPTFVNCNAVVTGKPGLKLCFTFNVKVTDDNGTPIVGAMVSLKDVDGTNAFTPTQTVAGGVLPADKIVTKYWYRHADQGGNKDYNDHTLKVVNGADETEYKIKIDHKITEDVVLLPQSVASYDNIMAGINDMKGAGWTAADSLKNITDDTDELQADWTDGGRLDLLLDDVPSTAEFEARTIVSADYVVVGDTLAGATAVGSVTGSVGSVVAGVDLSEAGADAVLDDVVEGTLTMRRILRLVKSFFAGKSSGGGTTNVKFRDDADAKDRINMTVDDKGNRSEVILDVD